MAASFEDSLKTAGFDTATEDGVVSGYKELGESAWEVKVDGGGGLLVRKTKIVFQKNKEVSVVGQKVQAVWENKESVQVRIKIKNSEELTAALKDLERI